MNKEKILKKFGQRIKEIRQKKNISQEKLAFKADMHRTYIGGIERGERNVSLLNMGVYAKKRWPEAWEKELTRLNSEYIDPPLPAEEVTGIIKNLRKKEYHFNCRAQPLVAYCNAALCKTREHGIGAEEASVRVTELRKLDTEPPLWFIDIDGHGTVQLSTDMLNSAIGFTKACMEQLSFRPVVPAKAWTAILSECFEKLIIIEMTDEERADGSISGAFASLVHAYLQRPPAETWDEVLLRKSFSDGEHVYFRFEDMINYTQRQGFRDYRRNEALRALTDLGGESHGQKKLPNGRNVRLWRMPVHWVEEDD
ncbi:hypothetical protein LCGC14_1812190 [marine sediment metagenome]|uniref:HTH cro/C1-type domain-containing protein n=1 Tax=marine sediment metagenome TaxID=412755 RepID=A0A0F9H9F7_9ZZZZ